MHPTRFLTAQSLVDKTASWDVGAHSTRPKTAIGINDRCDGLSHEGHGKEHAVWGRGDNGATGTVTMMLVNNWMNEYNGTTHQPTAQIGVGVWDFRSESRSVGSRVCVSERTKKHMWFGGSWSHVDVLDWTGITIWMLASGIGYTWHVGFPCALLISSFLLSNSFHLIYFSHKISV